MTVDPTSRPREELAEIEARPGARHAEAAPEQKLPVARVEDVDAGGVPARLYVPDGAPGALLYLHGGGFAIGDLVTHDGFARRLAVRTGWAVLMPDYRRSPEHAWPAAADDGAAPPTGWRPGLDRLVVVGDSAGSALAIGEALRHPDRYVAQVQVYPFVDPSCASYDTGWPGPTCLRAVSAVLAALPAGRRGRRARCTSSTLGASPGSRRPWCSSPSSTCSRRRAAATPSGSPPTAYRSVQVYPGVQHGFWRHVDNDQAGRRSTTSPTFLAGLG